MVNIIHIMLAFCFMFYFISSTSVASGNDKKEKCILQMVRANILMESTKNNYTIKPFGSQKAFHVLVPLCDHLEKVEKIKMEDNKADSSENAKKRQGSELQSENAKKRQGSVEKNEEKDDKGVEKNEEKAVLARSDAMNADSADSLIDAKIDKMFMDGELHRQQAREKVQKLKSELYTDENGIIDEELFQQDSKQLKVGMLASVEEIFKKLAEIKDKRSKLILKDLVKICTNLWYGDQMKKSIELKDLLPTCYDVNKYYGFQADNAEIVKIANDVKIAHTTKIAEIAKERSKLFNNVYSNLTDTCEFLILYGQKTYITDISFTAEDFLPLCILAKRSSHGEKFMDPNDFCKTLK